VLLFLLWISLPQPVHGAAPRRIANQQSAKSILDELERAKLVHEIRKLEQESRKLQQEIEGSAGASWQRFGYFATLFLAILGAFGALLRQIKEHSRDRREKLSTQFSRLITGLGSKSTAVQAGAAVGLLSYLRPEYEE
jgi:hypothetical protein